MDAHILDVDKVVNMAQYRCDDLGVSVRWCAHAQTAYTNGRQITLPVPGTPITYEALDTLYGMVIHECGHHLRSDAFKILKAATPPEHLCALYNIVEDDGMERERALAWRGDLKGLARMNSLLIKQAADQWAEHLGSEDAEGQPPEPLAAMMMGQMSRLNWDHESEPYVTALLNVYPTTAQKLVQELVDEGWVDKFRNTKTAVDTWIVAVDLAKRLYPNNDQDEYEEIKDAGNKMGQPRDDSNSSMPDPTGPSHKQESSNGQDGEGNEGEGDVSNGGDECEGGKDGQGATISWKDCVISEHNEWSEGNDNPGQFGITWEGRQGGKAKLMPTHMVNVVDLKNSKANPNEYGTEMYMPSDANSRAFANKVRRYIQAKARSVVRREREQGKLDKGMITRLGMPPIDGGEWNRKIFYDQRKHEMKDTAIFVLTDWSGSMSGRKKKYAADASQRLVWCFDRVLNVPVALALFSNRRSQCDIGYVKRFGTRGMTAETIALHFSRFDNYTSGNNDADSVNFAYREIMKRKESRKILIVLSDGAPSGSYAGHSDDALRTATGMIESAGKVELYGVGILSSAVDRYYTNNTVITNPEDINETLFRLIKDGDNV